MSFTPVWDITAFRARYIMFANLSDAVLNDLWIEAVDFGKPIIDKLCGDELKQHYYYVVEAHLATLEQKRSTGILNSASQGTVSASFDVDPSNALKWWNQTIWGSKIAQLMKRTGGFRFIPGCNGHGSRYGYYNRW